MREGGRKQLVNERCAELPGCPKVSALGCLKAVPPALSFEGKASQQGGNLAGGHCSRSQCPQWALLPAQFLAMWWYLWQSPFLFPVALAASVAASASCPIMLLYSTCDSIRYLVLRLSFHHILIIACHLCEKDNKMTLQLQMMFLTFRCCNASSTQDFFPYIFCISSQIDFRQGYLVHPVLRYH